jgi:hypothetical protein
MEDDQSSSKFFGFDQQSLRPMDFIQGGKEEEEKHGGDKNKNNPIYRHEST